MGFRADKKIPLHVVTDSATKMTQEVIGGGEVLAAHAATLSHVEARVLQPNSRHQFRGDVLGDGRRPDPVEVVENRSEWQRRSVEVRLIQSPAAAPGKLRARAKIPPQQDVGAYARGQTPSN